MSAKVRVKKKNQWLQPYFRCAKIVGDCLTVSIENNCNKYSVSHSLRNPAFLINSNTNEDIATKFEQEYVRCVRNEKECVCSVCSSAPNSCDTEQRRLVFGVGCPSGT